MMGYKAQKIIGCVLGSLIGLFLAYLFISFLSNYVDFQNPTPLDRLRLLVIACPFAYFAHYAFRKLGQLFKRSNSAYSRNNSYYKQEYSHTPRAINQIYDGENNQNKSHYGAGNTHQRPHYELPKFIHALYPPYFVKRIISRIKRLCNQKQIKPFYIPI